MSQAIAICANNAARLDVQKQSGPIEGLIVPVYEKACESLKEYKSEQIDKISTYSKAKLYNSLEYLNLLIPGQFTQGDTIFNKLKDSADNYKANTFISSKQREVYKLLESQQIKFEKEKRLYNYLVDAYIDPKIIVEFDGKPHYYSNTSVVISKKLMKSSYLGRKGYNLINIDYKDWANPEGRKKVIGEILFKLDREEKYSEVKP